MNIPNDEAVRNFALAGLMHKCSTPGQFRYHNTGCISLIDAGEKFDGAEIIVDFNLKRVLIRAWHISQHNGDEYGIKEFTNASWDAAMSYLKSSLEKDCYVQIKSQRDREREEAERKVLEKELNTVAMGFSTRQFGAMDFL